MFLKFQSGLPVEIFLIDDLPIECSGVPVLGNFPFSSTLFQHNMKLPANNTGITVFGSKADAVKPYLIGGCGIGLAAVKPKIKCNGNPIGLVACKPFHILGPKGIFCIDAIRGNPKYLICVDSI